LYFVYILTLDSGAVGVINPEDWIQNPKDDLQNQKEQESM